MTFHVPEKYRDCSQMVISRYGGTGKGTNNGVFRFAFGIRPRSMAMAIASDGEEWEHVSVSLEIKKIPNWEQMCWVKELFWDDEDCVVQYHPPRSDYVNCHPGVLHLWRPTTQELPRPPSIMVGPS